MDLRAGKFTTDREIRAQECPRHSCCQNEKQDDGIQKM